MKLNDLPDEVLLLILKELNSFEVFYSFHDINQRFNRILSDPIFTNYLNFVKWSCHKMITKFSSNLIHEFSSQILSKICTRIEWFNVESSFIRHILSTNKYSNLYGLGLYNIDEEIINFLFTDKNLSSDIFQNQITSLVIGIDLEKKEYVNRRKYTLFTMMKNLIHLTSYEASYDDFVRFKFDVSSRKFSSSTLLTLNIKAYTFNNCLCILDGRFINLQSLEVDLISIGRSFEQVENQREIPNLKCFNISCLSQFCEYNELLVPLLRRMSNLEKLGSYITASFKERFIDGTSLKEDILYHLTKMNFSSKEDVQQTFTDFLCTKVISYVDDFPDRPQTVQYHVYSYPFLMKSYKKITTNFPGGYYPYVRIVSLRDDEHPFEHEFFRQISVAFPVMSKLTVNNYCAQNSKQLMDINYNHFKVIRYNHLIELYIKDCHDDYTEQFVLNTKTYLHNSISLYIDLRSFFLQNPQEFVENF
ncbi:hypothetical protein I4U23_027118 [Adineta vaga]|nr:hypothetical protein I4U23_027118 [Adineta vaga]